MDRRPVREQRKSASPEDRVTFLVGFTLMAPILGLVITLILRSL
jgi:hypothetical protein